MYYYHKNIMLRSDSGKKEKLIATKCLEDFPKLGPSPLVKKRWKGTPLLSYWRIAGSNSHHAWAKQNFPWGSRGSVNVVPDIKDSIGSHPLPNWRDLRAPRKQKPETVTC